MKHLLISVFLLSFYFVNAQVEISEEEELINELFNTEVIDLQNIIEALYNHKAIYAAVNYTNKTYFAGRELRRLNGEVVDQISITPQLFYISSKGLILGASGLYLSELDPKWDTSILTVGFGKTIGKNFNMRYETTYSRYFYGKEYDNISRNSFDARFLVFSEDRMIGTEIEFSYLFGESEAFSASIGLIGNIKLLKFNKHSTLSFQPQFTFYVGEENIELYTIRFNQFRPYREYYYEKVFELFYAQLNMPLNLSFKDLDIEIGYNYNIPNKLENEPHLKNTSFANVAVRYTIDL